MINYRIKETGEIISDKAFRLRHKNTSFPRVLDDDLLNDFGIDLLFEGATPVCPAPYSYTYRDGVEEIDGKWFTKYSLGTYDKKEVDDRVAYNIRNQRDNLIKESDWRAVSDREIEPEWKEYRQALRDISKQKGFPHQVKWPEVPNN